MAYKPNNYNSVSPYLMVKDANRFVEMIRQVFNGQTTREYRREDGTVMHAEVIIDDSVIMFSEATEDYPVYTLWLHVYVPDVHATFEKAMQYGCESISRPEQKPGDPDCRGSFKDSDGINWSVSTQQD